jgi:hypothetical protein
VSCKPVTKKQSEPTAAEVALFMFPHRLLPSDTIKGFSRDPDANRRGFAQEVIQRLIDGGWRCLFPSGEFEAFYAEPEDSNNV